MINKSNLVCSVFPLYALSWKNNFGCSGCVLGLFMAILNNKYTLWCIGLNISAQMAFKLYNLNSLSLTI